MTIDQKKLVEEYKTHQAEGLGKGCGGDYRPWLDVRNTRSCAVRSTFWCLKLNRFVHVLSQGEYAAFLQFEWMDDVIDIREQFPLDPELTLSICSELKLLHPGFGRGGIVMTTDLLVTRRTKTGVSCEAYQIKQNQAALANRRTYAKLRVEEAYWRKKSVPWVVLFSEDFPRIRVFNLDRLRGYRAEKTIPADLDRLAELFRNWRELYPDAVPSSLPVGVFELPSGKEIRGEAAVLLLAAHKRLRFAIDNVRVDDCRLADFTEDADHAPA